MKEQTVVREKKTGELGVVIKDNFNLCSAGEIIVVFQGHSYGETTAIEELEVVGPENAQANFRQCGAGMGEKCCKFFVVVDGSPVCQRFGALRDSLIEIEMTSKRMPSEPYPKCQFDLGDVGC